MQYKRSIPRKYWSSFWRTRRCIVLLGVLGLLAAGCATSAPNSGKGPPVKGGIVTFAETVGGPANFIFPILPAEVNWVANATEFGTELWPPLYWMGQGGHPELNESLSVAYPPVFSNGDKTVTIRLKNYRWSDGAPVTSRDVEFYINLV
jgi:peptide/nickel transport system substrate-binding protein